MSCSHGVASGTEILQFLLVPLEAGSIPMDPMLEMLDFYILKNVTTCH